MKKVRNIKVHVNIKTRILVFSGLLLFYFILSSVSVNASTSISLVKSASPTTYSTVGQTITYTYKVTNTGTTTISGNFKVYDNITGILTITSSSLSSGKNITGTANYAITQINLDAGSVTNSAYAKSNGNTTTSNTVTATSTAVQNPALTLVKLASPTNYNAVGQNITYTYTVTNSGNVDLTGNITVTDNKTGTFNITSNGLNVGKNVTGTANYTIQLSDLGAGSVTNSANSTNQNTISNTVIATSTAIPLLSIKPTIPINCYAGAILGQNAEFVVNVTNTGGTGYLNVSLDNFTDAVGTGIFTQKGGDQTIHTQNDITNITTIGMWIDTSEGGSHTSPQSGDYVLNYNNSTATATKVLQPTAVVLF